MTYGVCPMCGERLISRSNRCRNCDFDLDSDYYPYFDEEGNTPDTWEDTGISDDALEKETSSKYM